LATSKTSNSSFQRHLIISPDERFVAVALPDKQEIWVRALPAGQEVKRQKFRHSVSHLAWSSDGQLLAIAWIKSKPPAEGMANRVHRMGVSLWNIKGGLRDFEMAKGEWVFDSPTQLRFSPDGQTLWMASTSNLRAWNIRSGQLKYQRNNTEGRDSSLPFFSVLSTDCRLNFRSDSSGYTVWDTKLKNICFVRNCLFSTMQTLIFHLMHLWLHILRIRQKAILLM
jgi:WD40 repeat protein